MNGKLLRKYFSSNKSEDTNGNLKQLEKITKRLIDAGSSPEYPIMQILMELSEHGVIGLNKDGIITIFNLSSANILGEENIRGKSLFDYVHKDCHNTLKSFLSAPEGHNVSKIAISAPIKDKIFDLIIYRVKNGEICFIIFMIDCLENLLFKRENCPLKSSCPFNNKCNTEEENK